MPARLVVSLQPVDVPRGGTWRDTGPAVHAALLDAIAAIDPEASALLHSPALRPKPYAISPLLGGDTRTREVSFEVGIADDEWIEVIAAALDERAEIRIGRSHFRIGRIDGYAATFDELLRRSPPSTGWRIELRTPTMWATSSGGQIRRRDLLPTPTILLGSLASRWRRHGGPLPDDVGLVVEDRIDVRAFELRTQRHLTKAPSVKVPGAVGWLEVVCVGPPIDDDLLRAISALLRFGHYVGVGDQTTKGMGVVTVSDLDDRPPGGGRSPRRRT